MFDGLDIHLYSLVATVFVAELMAQDVSSVDVQHKSAYIQAGFLAGWAVGGSVFGWLGDRIGRSRSLALTILTYALFTGLSTAAQTWWQLLIFRFISALGIGGEWAVGSSLLSETWPRKWRAWVAAVLQTGVNVGILVACIAAWIMAPLPPRYLFLVGVVPAFIVFWIRRKVPEPASWQAARDKAGAKMPSVLDLFRGPTRRTTLCAIGVCVFSLTAWWAFLFWDLNYLKSLPALSNGFDKSAAARAVAGLSRERGAACLCGVFSDHRRFRRGQLFRGVGGARLGYRSAIMVMFAGFFASFVLCYSVAWSDYRVLMFWMSMVGFFSGVFGLFTMYLPPLFPILLRTTGAGFCFNVGRLFAAAGTVIFGLAASVGDFRVALLIDGCLFLPAIAITLFMPDLRDGPGEPEETGAVLPDSSAAPVPAGG